MAYLLAALNILVYCTVYGDGIHTHSSAHPGHLFPLCINLLSTVRYCKFLCLFRLAFSCVPLPFLPSTFPQESHPQLDLTSMWFCKRRRTWF